jgi:hypothetical protein
MITHARWILSVVLTTALTSSAVHPALGAGSRSSGSSSRSSSSGGTYRQQTPANSGRQWTGQTQGNIKPGNAWPNKSAAHGPFLNNNANHVQNAMNKKFPNKNFNPYWKKYGGWGKWYGPRSLWFGWGWGSWYSPWCNWPYYEAVPVVEYANPYTGCAGVIVDGIDYSVPISQMPADAVVAEGADFFTAARAAFLQGNLDQALGTISQACVQTPHNHDAHQFHSLVLFAMKEYCKSAIVAYAVVQDGPGWTWDTLQTFYPSPDIYTGQLRSLEHFVGDNSSDANYRFLLAYHYLMLNHSDPARRQLTQVAALQPADKLAPRIRAGIGETPTPTPVVADNRSQTITSNRVTGPPPADAGSVAPPVAPPVANPANPLPLTGTWKASPDKNVKIELALRENGLFNWKFIANGRPKDFNGKYKLNDTTLTLVRDGDGDAMEGTFKRTGDNAFQFRMKDTDAEDPGLSFTR